MSVICFSKEEWQRFFDTLDYYQHRKHLDQIRIFSHAEILDHLQFNENKDEDKLKTELLCWFVRKVSVSNELCYAWNYHLDRGQHYNFRPAVELDDASIHNLMKINELFDFIDSIKYNCVSNGGSDFLPEELSKKLDNIQLQLGYMLSEKLKEVNNPVI